MEGSATIRKSETDTTDWKAIHLDSLIRIIDDTTVCKSSDYKYIDLIAKNYYKAMDLMFCYDDPARKYAGCLYIGEWNDGVIIIDDLKTK